VNGVRFVLDSSVALGAFFEDEQDDYSLAVWRSLSSARAIVPLLWHLEIGNILSRAIKARRMTARALDDCWQRIEVVGLEVRDVPADARLWAQRALEWQLSAYDACYLELARHHRLPLATKDEPLATAARRAGVPIYLSEPT
jgi:predicted nucleic acid-binding protein